MPTYFYFFLTPNSREDKSNEGVFATSPAVTGGGPLGEFLFYFGSPIIQEEDYFWANVESVSLSRIQFMTYLEFNYYFVV